MTRMSLVFLRDNTLFTLPSTEREKKQQHIFLEIIIVVLRYLEMSTQLDILTSANTAYGTSNSQTQSDILTTANSAYGTSEAARIDGMEEVANLESNDAYGIHSPDNEGEYATIADI